MKPPLSPGIVLALALAPVLAIGPVRAEPAAEAASARDTDFCGLPPLEPERREAYRAEVEDRENTPASARAEAALRLAGHDIAAASASPRACRQAFERGEDAFERALKKNTRKVRGSAGKADSDDPAIRAVQQRLRDAFIADQAARLAYLDLATQDREGADYWANRLATANAIRLDAAHTALLRELLETWDWIDAGRFGNRIASHAWTIAQHADADPEFQREVLARMEPYLATGGVRPRDYAYLYDRVAVNTGGLQRYGTQPEESCDADGGLTPRPMEAPESVDARRAEMGLGPIADALAEMAARRCRR